MQKHHCFWNYSTEYRTCQDKNLPKPKEKHPVSRVLSLHKMNKERGRKVVKQMRNNRLTIRSTNCGLGFLTPKEYMADLNNV